MKFTGLADRLYENMDRYYRVDGSAGFRSVDDLMETLNRSGMRQSMQKFVGDLLKKSATGEYDVIIGEDVSARIPTLVGHYILNNAKKDGLIAYKPDVIFVASGRLHPCYQSYRDGFSYIDSDKNLDRIHADYFDRWEDIMDRTSDIDEVLKDMFPTITDDDIAEANLPSIIWQEYLERQKNGGRHLAYDLSQPEDIWELAYEVIWDRAEVIYSNKVRKYLRETLGGLGVRQALIVTDIVDTGRSIGRISRSLTDMLIGDQLLVVGADSTDRRQYLYMGSSPRRSYKRPAVGVERRGVEPVTSRHPYFDSKRVSSLRLGLKGYANELYSEVKKTFLD